MQRTQQPHRDHRLYVYNMRTYLVTKVTIGYCNRTTKKKIITLLHRGLVSLHMNPLGNIRQAKVQPNHQYV
jgi:hypothetical protein